jgi:hypothetical protein
VFSLEQSRSLPQSVKATVQRGFCLIARPPRALSLPLNLQGFGKSRWQL